MYLRSYWTARVAVQYVFYVSTTRLVNSVISLTYASLFKVKHGLKIQTKLYLSSTSGMILAKGYYRNVMTIYFPLNSRLIIC